MAGTGTDIYVNGTLVDLAEINAWPDRLDLRIEGISTLSLGRRGGCLPATPDPLMGKPVRVDYNGTTIFAGDLYDVQADFTAQGYGNTYQARCLRNRGDQVPFQDANTLTTTASYNYPSDSEFYFASRAGLTVGEIVRDCLEMATNAGPLAALGIGKYTESGGDYSLPASTLADLAALDQIPTGVCTVSGPRCLSAVESFVQSIYPGHALNVQPDGTIRVFDLLDPTAVTLTLEDLTDLASPPSVRRSLADCFTKVTIFGQPRTVAKLVSLQNGGLQEWFQYPGVTNSAAKDAWTTDVYKYGQTSRSTGTASCTDTLHVVLTSADSTQTWDADAFGPSAQQGVLHLWKNVVSGVDSIYSVKVVANTALSAGGTSTFTLESPLPATDYDGYTLYGFDQGPALVYRRYRVVDEDMRHALARKFSPSAVWVGAYGGSATSTNFPMASVCWDGNEVTDGFAIDIADGTITFFVPTYITAGNREPSDVRVLIAVNEDSLTATAPASGYEGTAYTVDGLPREQRIFMKSWTDPGNQAAMDDYARQLLDTNKNTVVDLSLQVNRILDEVLPLANQGLNITADGYSTGLEDANLPISGLSIVWNNGSPSLHTTSVTASNRRQPPSDNILPPERQRQGGYLWGATTSDTLNPWDKAKTDAGGGA